MRPDNDLLDVACGTGNTALRAAISGADVVARDLTPASLAVGRREAELLGLALKEGQRAGSGMCWSGGAGSARAAPPARRRGR